MAKILVINSGSSSIKFQVITMPGERRLLTGQLDGIGGNAILSHDAPGHPGDRRSVAAADHAAGLDAIFDLLDGRGFTGKDDGLAAVGHRVVHGGEALTAPVLIDGDVLARLQAASRLAPLHNVANLDGIDAARERFPDLPQVAVFDTAFHHDLPEHARYYGLPLDLQREQQIRRYGFHGISHQHVAGAAAAWLGHPPDHCRLISLHLGNGASACAIDGGRSVDTSMGFTPLEGLLMGTRCGDLDPALPRHLAACLQQSNSEIDSLLNRESGLLGICGDSDMRKVERRMPDDARARLAFALFCYRAKKYVGAYFAVLNGIDALVFTAGVGEHSAAVRASVCSGLDALGIAVDPARNASPGSGVAEISPPDAAIRVLVVPADEEVQIARATHGCLRGRPPARGRMRSVG